MERDKEREEWKKMKEEGNDGQNVPILISMANEHYKALVANHPHVFLTMKPDTHAMCDTQHHAIQNHC